MLVPLNSDVVLQGLLCKADKPQVGLEVLKEKHRHLGDGDHIT